MRVNVIGLEGSQGIGKESQKAYAIGKLHILVKIDNGAFSQREGNFAKGAMGQTIQVDLAILAKVSHIPPPFVAEVTYDMVSRFGELKQEVVELVPVERATGDQADKPAGRAMAKA